MSDRVRPPPAPAIDPGDPGSRLRRNPDIHPDDPAHALIIAVEALQKQAVRDMGALVTKLSDDVAASAVLAEKAARAKAEVVVTQAGEWAAAQIRDAGRKAAAEVIEAQQTLPPADSTDDWPWTWITAFATFIAGLALGVLIK